MKTCLLWMTRKDFCGDKGCTNLFLTKIHQIKILLLQKR